MGPNIIKKDIEIIQRVNLGNKGKKYKPKTRRFSSKKEEQEFLKENYVNWEDLVIDKNGEVTWNEATKKVFIKLGHDLDDCRPAKY